MTNPTSNYSFQMPTASDLVTDLPADFEVFGQAVDTRLKALQPGTTLGDIAYSSATANTSTRLPIGTTGQVLAVSGGVPTWTTTADVTPLTTKGDLFTFTTVDARLAVGNNGETLVADSSTSSGLRYTAGNPIANPVLNSAYQVWQRGTSFTATNNAYTADRWQVYTGASTVSTVSRVATGDTTNLPNIQYALRYQRNSGQTGTALQFVTQSFESVNSIPYAGKSVTISFYARAGSNYSSASNVLTCNLKSGTGTDQNLITGFTSATNVIDQNATLTTTWQRFTYTGTVAAAATQLGVQFYFTPSGTAGANDYFEVTGVQLDIGSVALPFRTYAGTIQGELAACQRYYYRATAGAAYSYLGGIGSAGSTTLVQAMVTNPVTMRTNPSAIDYSTVAVYDTVAITSVTALTIIYASPTTQMLNATVASGLTQYRTYSLIANASSSAYIGLSAEL